MFINQLSKIDWNMVWNRKMQAVTINGEGADFWDSKARQFHDVDRHSPYITELLNRIELSEEQSVLDAGCGSGLLSVPVAKKVNRVTALDWSPVMLDELEKYATGEGISNIRLICKDLAQAEIDGDIKRHDVVVASRSLPMGDLHHTLSILNRAAGQACYLTWLAGGDDLSAEVFSVINMEYHPFPEYVIIYNLLYVMGITANIEIFNIRQHHRFKNADEALKVAIKDFHLSKNDKNRIKSYLLEKWLDYDGKDYTITTKKKWALIWWMKDR